MNSCEICGTQFDLKEIDGHYICNECVENKSFAICNSCNKLISNGEYHIVCEEVYCYDCSMLCEDCGKTILTSDAIETRGDYCICQDCYHSNYTTCERCSDVFDYEEASFVNSFAYCEDCYESALSDYNIHIYNYKPNCEFLNCDEESEVRSNNLHIGVELEIQGGDKYGFSMDVGRDYDFDDGIFYLKEDGSLDETGVEIVSQPMTYKYITEMGEWENIFEKINKFNMNDDTFDCGLHFHIDKAYLDKDNIATIDYIVNMFDDYFSTVGGRKYAYYFQKREKTIDNWGKNSERRYSACNLNNRDTVELRFCKSTYNYNTFIQRVQLIFAIVEFSKQYKIGDVSYWSNSCFLEKFNAVFKKMFNKYIDTSLE